MDSYNFRLLRSVDYNHDCGQIRILVLVYFLVVEIERRHLSDTGSGAVDA